MRAHAPILSALLTQRVRPPLQPSAVTPLPPLPQSLSFPLKLDMLPLQPIVAHDPTPPISVLLQGQGEPPILPSTTMRAYVTLLSALLLRIGVPIRHPSAKPAHLPLISALLPKQVDLTLQTSAVILLLFLRFQPCL